MPSLIDSTSANLKSAAELATLRQTILDSFGANDSEAADLANMDRLYPVEAMLAEATYETNADKQAGKLILLEVAPNKWDNFQCSLFKRMQQFN